MKKKNTNENSHLQKGVVFSDFDMAKDAAFLRGLNVKQILFNKDSETEFALIEKSEKTAYVGFPEINPVKEVLLREFNFNFY